MDEPLEIHTQRLHLRQWRAQDFAPLAALNADPRVMAHFPAVLARAESDAFARRCQALIAERGWGLWAVARRDTGELLGLCGLNEPAPEVPVSPCVEVGWRFAFAHWGYGYAREAAEGALRVGFETLGIDEIIAFTTIGNGRSRALMERLGMAQAAGGFVHPRLPADSPLREHCVYRLSRARWGMLRDR